MVHPVDGGAAVRVTAKLAKAHRRDSGQRGTQTSGALGRVVRFGDRPYDDHAFGSGGDHLADVGVVDPSDGEPRPGRASAGFLSSGVADEVGTDGGPTGLGRGRPDGPDAEVVQAVSAERGIDLFRGVSGEADDRLLSDDSACDVRGEVFLPEVEDRRAGDAGDVRAVVDRPQLPVPGCDLGKHVEDFELLAALDGLVAQLDDVDTAGVGGVDEVGEVALAGAGVGAEVELCGGEGHEASVSARPVHPGRAVADVAVIGGGIVGLSIAWTAVQRGLSVRLIDPAPAQGATYAAAGMLAPVSEYHYQEDDLLPLMLESASQYPEFVRRLTPERSTVAAATGYLRTATLLVGVDHGDRQALADLHAAHRRWDLPVEPLTIREARSREPLLGPRVTSAYCVEGDHQIDPRILAARLLAELTRAEAAEIVRERAAALVHANPADTDSPVVGVQLESGAIVSAGHVVLANGLGATSVGGLPTRLTLPLRPVFGDILRLRVPERLRPLLTATVRALVRGESVYLVPRTDGTLVVGATQREDGLDGLSAGGVHRLLRDAQEVLPAVAELELIETTARARPATPDNAPLLGSVCALDGGEIPGLIVATGFFRHGVLLAPAAADLCLDLIEGPVAGARWHAFRPDRFSPLGAASAAGRTSR